MLDFYQRWAKTIGYALIFMVTLFLVYTSFRYLFQIAAPIFIAYFIFLILQPMSEFLQKLKFSRKAAVNVATFLFITIIVGIFGLAVTVFSIQVQNIAQFFPKYATIFQDQFDKWVHYVQAEIQQLPPETMEQLKQHMGSFAQKGSAIASSILLGLFNKASILANFTLHFAIGTLLAYYLTLRIEVLREKMGKSTPRTFKKAFLFLKEKVLLAISKYIKAQSKLIFYSFVLMFIGLIILRVENAFSIALIGAVLDIMPVVGIAVIFIPWLIYSLMVGKVGLGIGLGVLFLVVTVFRQIMEPKVVGDSLGVTEFEMLAYMVIGLNIFGVLGMILTPLVVILINAIQEEGYFKKWIPLPKEEFSDEKTD